MTKNIVSKIKILFSAPIFEDEEKNRVARLLQLILPTWLSLSLMLCVINLLISQEHGYYILTIYGFFILPQLLPLWMMKRGHIFASCYLFLFILTLQILVYIFLANGIFSIGLSSQLLLVILIGLLIGHRASLVTAVSWIVIDIMLVVLNRIGGLLPQAVLVETPVSRLSAQSFNLIATTVMLYLTIRGLQEAISRAHKNEQYLSQLANHDLLTSLPNRGLFNDRLQHAIAKAKRNSQKLAVLFLDLDDFKTINDAFGHEYGDQILQMAADKIRTCVRASDTAARVGGDEFVLLLEDISNPEYAAIVAQKIIKAFSLPFLFSHAEIFLSTSIGISVFPDNGDTPQALLQNADITMYRAKRKGKNNYQFYSAELAVKAIERLSLASYLRHAIEKDELVLYYQPQIDTHSGKLVGVEALLRWNHPQLGMIPPAQFIPLAEETGLIVPIGEWVLRTACKQNKKWIDEGLAPMRVAVNLSEKQLQQPDIVEKIEQCLNESQLPPHLLELELTENIVFQHLESTLALLERLKDLGVYLSVDDFGTGYSTLSQLARFPFDTLKIDRYFASNVTEASKNAAVVSGIIRIAQKLGMDVIAEGVETSEQLSFYENQGCNQIQGWYFSKALPADILVQSWLSAGTKLLPPEEI